MAKNVSFESLSMEYQSRINTAMYNLSMSRTKDEADEAGKSAHKVISEYTRKIKTFVDMATLQAVKDHSEMLRILNDRLSLDPGKVELSYTINRNTVRWTIHLVAQDEDYFFMSVRGVPVVMERFYDWCMSMLT